MKCKYPCKECAYVLDSHWAAFSANWKIRWGSRSPPFDPQTTDISQRRFWAAVYFPYNYVASQTTNTFSDMVAVFDEVVNASIPSYNWDALAALVTRYGSVPRTGEDYRKYALNFNLRYSFCSSCVDGSFQSGTSAYQNAIYCSQCVDDYCGICTSSGCSKCLSGFIINPVSSYPVCVGCDLSCLTCSLASTTQCLTC